MMRDKQPEACASLLASCAAFVVATQVEGPRALSAQDLANLYQARGARAEAIPEPGQALQKARVLAGPGGVVVACGSLYLVGEIMKLAGRKA